MRQERDISPEDLELRRTEIIEKNLAKMVPGEEMYRVHVGESMGGNAGRVEIEGEYYSCSGINGVFDSQTGEIIGFYSEARDLVKDLVNTRENNPNSHHFILRVANTFSNKRFPHIDILVVEIVIPETPFESNVEEVEATEGFDILKETTERFNIQKAKNFDELYFILKATGNIKGTHKSYTPDELIELIKKVRKRKLPVEYITRRAGLRHKVLELLQKV